MSQEPWPSLLRTAAQLHAGFAVAISGLLPHTPNTPMRNSRDQGLDALELPRPGWHVAGGLAAGTLLPPHQTEGDLQAKPTNKTEKVYFCGMWRPSPARRSQATYKKN